MWLGKNNNFEGTSHPHGKEEVWWGKPQATLHCPRKGRSDNWDPRPGRQAQRLRAQRCRGRAGGKSRRGRKDDVEPQEVNPVAPPSDPRTESRQRARNLKSPLRRNKIKWPKANETEEWKKLDEHLSKLLQNILRGSVESKLNRLGEILYEECSNRYGEVTIREAAPRSKGRREKEIDELVAGRRQLRKRWKKSEEFEKEGLKVLRVGKESPCQPYGGRSASEGRGKGRKKKDQASTGIHSSTHEGSLRRRQAEHWCCVSIQVLCP